MLGTYGNWKGVEWWGEGYEHLWEEEKGTEGERVYTCPVTGTSRTRSGSDREKVVYLTADSDAELLELNPEETYVIGGIVDKNRYKVKRNPPRSPSLSRVGTVLTRPPVVVSA